LSKSSRKTFVMCVIASPDQKKKGFQFYREGVSGASFAMPLALVYFSLNKKGRTAFIIYKINSYKQERKDKGNLEKALNVFARRPVELW
jgi:hypothetical protein